MKINNTTPEVTDDAAQRKMLDEFYNDGFTTGEDGKIVVPIEQAPVEDKEEEAPSEEEESKPVAEAPEEDEKKEEPKLPDFSSIVEDVKKAETQTPQPQDTGKPKSRDFSMFPPQYHQELKRMSNEAFDLVKEWWKEKQELAEKHTQAQAKLEQFGGAFMPTAESYRFHPKYNEFVNAVTEADQVRNHWQQQAIALEQGADTIQDLFLDDNGKLQTRPVPVTEEDRPRLRVAINGQMQQAAVIRQEAIQKAQAFQTDFNNQVGKLNGYLNTFRQKYLPPNLIDKPIVDRVLQEFPEYLRTDPRHQLIAEMFALAANMDRIIKGKMAQKTFKDKVKSAAGKNNVSNEGAGAGDGGVFDFKTGLARLRRIAGRNTSL